VVNATTAAGLRPLIQLTMHDRTAFVFAGGGSVGVAEVGMAQALVEHGVLPDFVVGSSAGAINSLHFAAVPTLEGVASLAQLWCELSRADVFPVTRLHGLMALVGRRPSLLDPKSLRRTLESRLPVQRLEDTVIPCHIVATSLRSGAEVVLSTGSVIDALLATTAVPVLFPPHRVGDELLTDGGVSANAPIATAFALGATHVIVLPTGFPCAVRALPASLPATILHTFSLMIARQLGADIHRVPSTARLRIVPPLCPMHVAPHDFSQARTLIDDALAQTRLWLAGGGLDRNETPAALHPHSHIDD
jgi:NTE family protein